MMTAVYADAVLQAQKRFARVLELPARQAQLVQRALARATALQAHVMDAMRAGPLPDGLADKMVAANNDVTAAHSRLAKLSMAAAAARAELETAVADLARHDLVIRQRVLWYTKQQIEKG